MIHVQEYAAICDILWGYITLLLSNNLDFPDTLSSLHINIYHTAISQKTWIQEGHYIAANAHLVYSNNLVLYLY